MFLFFFIEAAGAFLPANIFNILGGLSFFQGYGLGHRFIETLPGLFVKRGETESHKHILFRGESEVIRPLNFPIRARMGP